MSTNPNGESERGAWHQPRTWGWISLAIWVAHAADSLRLHEPYNLFWACNVSCLLIAWGLLKDSPLAHATGLMWLVTGFPFWVVDMATGGEFIATSFLTHIGGLLAASLALRERRIPRGSWWKAFLLWVSFQLLCRAVTPPKDNVNLVWAVWPGWEGVFPTFARYHAFLLTVSLSSFFLTERVALAVGTRAEARPA